MPTIGRVGSRTLQVLALFFPNVMDRQAPACEGGSILTHVVSPSHMDDWFSVIAAGCELPASAVRELDDVGLVVVPGPVAPPQLSPLRAVYDAACRSPTPPTSTVDGRQRGCRTSSIVPPTSMPSIAVTASTVE